MKKKAKKRTIIMWIVGLSGAIMGGFFSIPYINNKTENDIYRIFSNGTVVYYWLIFSLIGTILFLFIAYVLMSIFSNGNTKKAKN
jgi:hypothetical protein